jgi:hypothetical protein
VLPPKILYCAGWQGAKAIISSTVGRGDAVGTHAKEGDYLLTPVLGDSQDAVRTPSRKPRANAQVKPVRSIEHLRVTQKAEVQHRYHRAPASNERQGKGESVQ